jgi:hypothetical protein
MDCSLQSNFRKRMIRGSVFQKRFELTDIPFADGVSADHGEGGEMQNHHNDRCARNDLSALEVRISERMPDFITVHTFGGRGSPSF